MPLTRREMIGLGAGAAAAVAVPWRVPLPQSVSPIKKTIPSTGEQLTPIGVGTNRYGVSASSSTMTELRSTLARFHALGGQVIDTAEEYGRAEGNIGDLTHALGINDELFIATKIRMVGREAGIRSVEQSFDRLQRERLDLVQVHDLTDYSTHIRTLRDLKADGRIRYIGITASRHAYAAEMERLMNTGDVDFVQLSYTLDERRAASRLLPLATDRGIAVIVNRPFGSGSLFRRIGEHPLPDWAADIDCTSWGQFVLKYIISHPAVTCAVAGTRRESHVVDNLGAAYGRLPDAELRARQERFFDDIA
ncbi:MAG: aldo/keto reductase [Gammaproteobacteria bacterium]|nr:aldo/keto reductase [Gammaproteobacteria bacterium]